MINRALSVSYGRIFTILRSVTTSVKILPYENLKTQQLQAAETLECTLEHAHNNHHFSRQFGFVIEEDSGRQIT